jgi:hypothetical protein
MKKALLSILLCTISAILFAQQHKCYTDQVNAQYAAANPSYAHQQKQQEAAVRQWIAANRQNLKTTGGGLLATIPVVFHVVYKNAAQNIADSNLFRQIAIMNECYRKNNANYSQTRPIFDSIGADIQIEFCLAQSDPSGNPTQGITRKSAPSNAGFDPVFNMDKVKSSATNGEDPWPNDQYLNIWVCDMSLFGIPFVLGYATFPGSDPTLDGVVIQYNFIGYQNNGTTNNLGRTTVHETGHWLGMRHIWGDGQGSSTVCDSSDYVDDTPNADTASQQTCLVKNSCSNESPYWTAAGVDPPDMIENYMDYSYDACMTMFTEGQKARMWGFINTLRLPLLTSPGGCNPIGLAHTNTNKLIDIFPNPASSTLTIQAKRKTNLTINFTDAPGRKLGSYAISETNGTIDISAFQAGVLFYEICEQGVKIQCGKVIKVE